jgi:hypothetical protein
VAPVTVFPTPLQTSFFKEAVQLAIPFNSLTHVVAHDIQFLSHALRQYTFSLSLSFKCLFSILCLSSLLTTSKFNNERLVYTTPSHKNYWISTNKLSLKAWRKQRCLVFTALTT